MKKAIVIGLVAGAAVITGTGVAVKNKSEIKEYFGHKLHQGQLHRGIKNTTKGLRHLDAVRRGEKKQKTIDLGIANLLVARPDMDAYDEPDVVDTRFIIDVAIDNAREEGIDIDVLMEFSKKILEDYMSDVISKSGEEFDLSEEGQSEVQAAFCEGMKAAMGMDDEEEPVNV